MILSQSLYRKSGLQKTDVKKTFHKTVVRRFLALTQHFHKEQIGHLFQNRNEIGDILIQKQSQIESMRFLISPVIMQGA